VPLDAVARSMMNRPVWALAARNGDAGRVVGTKRERVGRIWYSDFDDEGAGT
jgi:hypothetical protein